MLILIFVLMTTNFVILCFVDEGRSDTDEIPATLSVVKLVARKVIRLDHIRKLAIIFVTYCMCAATIFHGKLFYIQLQEKGFTRSEIGKIELYLAPL